MLSLDFKGVQSLLKSLQKRGFSLRAVAKETGLDATRLSRIVNETNYPTASSIKHVSDALLSSNLVQWEPLAATTYESDGELYFCEISKMIAASVE